MHKSLFSKTLTVTDHFRILKNLLIFTNGTAMVLYIFLRALFLSTPISTNDDVIAVLKTLMVGSLAALGMYAVLVVTEIADYLFVRRSLTPLTVLKYSSLVLFTFLLFYFSSRKPKFPDRSYTDQQAESQSRVG